MSNPEESAGAAGPWPATGRIAGIDYGTVRIGIAVTDPDRRLASPWETYPRRSTTADAEYFRRLVREERLVGFVVGLPVFASGDESPMSREARKFGHWLTAVTERPVVFFDERHSSCAANEFLAQGKLTAKRRQQLRDQLAAQILLAAFLESGQRPTNQAASLTDDAG